MRIVSSFRCLNFLFVFLFFIFFSSLSLTQTHKQKDIKIPDNFSILLTGDILIAENMLDFMKLFGDYYPIRQISPLLDYFDYVFANLETPITTHTVPLGRKPYLFRLHPKSADMIAQLKIDIVSIANNHIMDYGKEGLIDTIKWLNKNNIKYTGAGFNLDEARTPAIFTHNDIEIVFLAYNDRPPRYFDAAEKLPGAAPLNLKIIKEDIKKYKNKSSIVLVSLHWGVEQTLYPTKRQRAIAKQIIDAGANGIIGHHPHWPQGIQIYKGAPIVYSLGNFLNGYYNVKEQDNIFVVLNCKGTKITSLDIIPIAGRNSKINFQPYQLTSREGNRQLRLIQRISNRFGTKIQIDKDIGRIKIKK